VIKSGRQPQPQRLPPIKGATTDRPTHYRVLGVDGPSPRFCGELAATPNCTCEWTEWSHALRDQLHRHSPDLLLLIAAPPCQAADDFFRRLALDPIFVPTLVILPPDHRLPGTALQAINDFIIAPPRQGELQHRIAKLLGQGTKAAAREQINQDLTLAGLVGQHPAFVRTLAQLPLIARTDSPTLISGETGTGKELCARAIHHLGERRHLPFVPVDCAALPEHLFESEMFGHVRGAFTDAYRDQKGLVALAGAGTLFLDEIDSLSIAAQTKLLRLLQERTYRPVGSERFVRTSVKIVAASNQDLERMVAEKTFRSDLFFRLNVLRLKLPPLRERRSDIEVLAGHFLATLACELGMPCKTLAPGALQRLAAYDWPGNVRELYNVLHRTVVLTTDRHVTHVDLPDPPLSSPPLEPGEGTFGEARARTLASFEKRYVEDMLRRSCGNVTRAAQLAGKDRRVFGRLMKRHNITRNLGLVPD